MSAIGMACNVTFRTFACIFASERKHISTMAAPIRADIRQGFESMGDAVINLLFIALLKTQLG
jgi:hypothetical protein